MKKVFGKIALMSCVYYTASVFLILLLSAIVSRDLSHGVKPVSLILILPFAVLFAAANYLYRHAAFGKFWRLLLHFILTVGGAFCFLYLPNRGDGGRGGVLLLVLTVLYAVIMGTVLLIGARVRRVTRDESDYQSVYKK